MQTTVGYFGTLIKWESKPTRHSKYQINISSSNLQLFSHHSLINRLNISLYWFRLLFRMVGKYCAWLSPQWFICDGSSRSDSSLNYLPPDALCLTASLKGNVRFLSSYFFCAKHCDLLNIVPQSYLWLHLLHQWSFCKACARQKCRAEDILETQSIIWSDFLFGH